MTRRPRQKRVRGARHPVDPLNSGRDTGTPDATRFGTIRRGKHVFTFHRGAPRLAALPAALVESAGLVLVPTHGPPLVVLPWGAFLREWQRRPHVPPHDPATKEGQKP